MDEINDPNSKSLEFSLTHASIDRLELKKIKKDNKIEYSEQSIELISCCLNEILNDQNFYHDKMVLISS